MYGERLTGQFNTLKLALLVIISFTWSEIMVLMLVVNVRV